MKKDTKLFKELEQEKRAIIVTYPDGYAIVSLATRDRKILKIGDRVKNAIKALLKEGYSIEVQTIQQEEMPFYTEGTNS